MLEMVVLMDGLCGATCRLGGGEKALWEAGLLLCPLESPGVWRGGSPIPLPHQLGSSLSDLGHSLRPMCPVWVQGARNGGLPSASWKKPSR